MPILVGFWSYSRCDDVHSDGHLSLLRCLMGKALALQHGADIVIWQDIQSMPTGSDWAASIERSIGQALFFIPIITPRYLKSKNCLAEFQSFRHRMLELGCDDLIFPILYVSVGQISAEDTVFGSNLEALLRHQWTDFRQLRHVDCHSHEVRARIDELAEYILRVAVPVLQARTCGP
ncbi:toll/interleukin-1 receptor domain-containing protein [Caballeronia sp. LZ029]|uniref:toll/interleukin-1 receptor domain-containing protein n=1 Tax=Caballeronia sp. LZ029 TaxID=3038564 RepID=UPI00285A3F93|nr:toll/interleukin-1 receptor domain-containing protein [Caballeronia sp. LZ029]MDR5742487.1 toll/interleukin-1 receptor domain-containing protein [Caballeronia sp. LZ029]